MRYRFVYIILSVVSLLCLSCQKEQGGNSEGEVSTSFVLHLGENGTKSVSQANLVDRVYYEVWDDSFQMRLFPTEENQENFVPVEGSVAQVDIKLLKDQTFNIIFWAQNSGCNVYSWSDLKNVSVDYAGFTSNNKDIYDAFYAVEQVYSNGKDKTVYLHRPFAQLNFGTDNMDTSLGEIAILSNSVEVSEVATSFNTLLGRSNADSYISNVVFSAPQGGLVQQEREDKKDLSAGNANYYWVAMNYLLIPSTTDASVVVNAQFTTQFGTVSHSINNVPLKKNHMTNIVGDLFTNDASIKVVVVPVFLKPDLTN